MVEAGLGRPTLGVLKEVGVFRGFKSLSSKSRTPRSETSRVAELLGLLGLLVFNQMFVAHALMDYYFVSFGEQANIYHLCQGIGLDKGDAFGGRSSRGSDL